MKVGLHFIYLIDEDHLLPPETPPAAEAGASAGEVVQVGAPVQMLRANIQDETREEFRGVLIDGSPDGCVPVRLGCLHDLVLLEPMLGEAIENSFWSKVGMEAVRSVGAMLGSMLSAPSRATISFHA